MAMLAKFARTPRALFSLLVVLVLSLALTSVGIHGAEPAHAASCEGYVTNSQWSGAAIEVKSSDTPWQRITAGNTWYGDHPVASVSIRILVAYAWIDYSDAATNAPLGKGEVGPGIYEVNPCHNAHVNTQYTWGATRSGNCLVNAPAGYVENGAGWNLFTTTRVAHRNITAPPDPAGDRAERATACLVDPRRSVTDTKVDITGWRDAQGTAAAWYRAPTPVSRCHLIADILGGTRVAKNFVPCWQTPVNSGTGSMQTRETQVQEALGPQGRRLPAGHAVYYQVTPVYRTIDSTIPYAISMTAVVQDPNGVTVRPLFADTIPNERSVNGVMVNLGN